MQQKLFNFFLPQEAGASRNDIEKKPQKPHPKLKKYVCYRFTDNICCLQSNASGNFLQKCINFVEQRLKFSYFRVRKLNNNFKIAIFKLPDLKVV